MSELDRLKRIVSSWVGKVRYRKKRRLAVFQDDDALLILNDLGMQMSAAALEFLAGNSTRREDFLLQIYAAEEELGADLIKDNVMIDPVFEPRVYEESGKLAISVKVGGDEVIVAEYPFQA